MANSLSAASPLLWSKIMGRKRFKTNVFRALASFAEQPSLTFGLSVDRPYRSNLVVENYTKGTAANVQDISATSDKLEINKQKTILIYIDTVDKLQNKYDLMQVNAEEMGKRQGEAMDAEFLYEVINANNTIDAADFGGSSGQNQPQAQLAELPGGGPLRGYFPAVPRDLVELHLGQGELAWR
jgi:hypothetical protein